MEKMLVALVALFGTTALARPSPYPSRRDGIKPAQTAKPRKITVRGAKGKPVFHSQRSQMSVRYEMAMHARQREKFAQQLGVPFRWLRYPRRFARKPCMDLLPRIANRLRMLKYTRISYP